MSYVPVADRDPLSRPAWLSMNGSSYGAITYSKTALMMLTLESLIGEKTVLHGLRVYFERYKFKHPTPDDFTAAMNEAMGQNLDWYWKQAIYGTETLDDRILTASSERLDWYSKAEEKKGVTVYHNEVIVHRRGDFRFAGGAGGEVRRWLRRCASAGTARTAGIALPGSARRSWSRRRSIRIMAICWIATRSTIAGPRKPDRRASGKLAGYWTLLTQWLEQALSWLA